MAAPGIGTGGAAPPRLRDLDISPTLLAALMRLSNKTSLPLLAHNEHAGEVVRMSAVAVLFYDDVVADRQAKPSTFSIGLVVKNGLKRHSAAPPAGALMTRSV